MSLISAGSISLDSTFKNQIYSVLFLLFGCLFLTILDMGRDLANQANSDSVRMSGYLKLVSITGSKFNICCSGLNSEKLIKD